MMSRMSVSRCCCDQSPTQEDSFLINYITYENPRSSIYNAAGTPAGGFSIGWNTAANVRSAMIRSASLSSLAGRTIVSATITFPTDFFAGDLNIWQTIIRAIMPGEAATTNGEVEASTKSVSSVTWLGSDLPGAGGGPTTIPDFAGPLQEYIDDPGFGANPAPSIHFDESNTVAATQAYNSAIGVAVGIMTVIHSA